MKEKKILIISGATSSGKSSLAEQIAERLNSVIINADSMQLYSELPILSAQPDLSSSKPYFLYSILKYSQESSVVAWLNLARNAIDKALESNQLPIVVGGTGLYISKLVDGINEIPEINPELKNHLHQLAQDLDKKELIEILIGLGDDINEIERLDKQRLTRRWEVLKQTGHSLSWWKNSPKQEFYPKNSFVHINIDLPRDLLYQNCNRRLEIMLKNGAIEEVKKLAQLNPDQNLTITKTIGYQEIKDYLNNLIDKKTAIEIASKKTRNYAKRQLTWFRNQFKDKIVIGDPEKKMDKIFKLL